jgi:hypothetical protein
MTSPLFAQHTDAAAPEPEAPDTVELTDSPAGHWFATWADARAQIAGLKELEATARQNLEAAIGDATTATYNGQPVITYKRTTSRSFDQSTARQFLTAEQWAACQREKPTRTFREVN